MAYNFLELVNAVARRLNETELTSSNFATATGFYAQIKDAVNSSIRDLNLHHEYWPYNHNSESITLTAGVTRYPIPADAKFVDYNNFRLERDTSVDIGAARRLEQITYNEYIDTYVDQENETDTSKGAATTNVFKTLDNSFGVVPMPDKAYTITYEYFNFPVDLNLYTDVPSVPERFKFVITDGAMYHAYMFRDNIEMGQLAFKKFEDGMKYMRKLLVNENVYLRAT
tara:strand:+ start:17358 stop:18038 length:681 start_codon:yes stop_codon:yes gene_type:complete